MVDPCQRQTAVLVDEVSQAQRPVMLTAILGDENKMVALHFLVSLT